MSEEVSLDVEGVLELDILTEETSTTEVEFEVVESIEMDIIEERP